MHAAIIKDEQPLSVILIDANKVNLSGKKRSKSLQLHSNIIQTYSITTNGGIYQHTVKLTY